MQEALRLSRLEAPAGSAASSSGAAPQPSASAAGGASAGASGQAAPVLHEPEEEPRVTQLEQEPASSSCGVAASFHPPSQPHTGSPPQNLTTSEARRPTVLPAAEVWIGPPPGGLPRVGPGESRWCCRRQPALSPQPPQQPEPAPSIASSPASGWPPRPQLEHRGQALQGVAVSSERIDRAKAAGSAGASKVHGLLRFVPATPVLHGLAARRLCFVVLRAADGVTKGFRDGPYHTVQGWVCAEGRIAPMAVFHGFETIQEAAVYWAAAGQRQPWPFLPSRT